MMKSKRTLKIISIFTSFLLALFLLSPQVEARYKEEYNTVKKSDIIFDASKNELVVNVHYQYQVKDIQVYICDADKPTALNCMLEYSTVYKDYINFADHTEGMYKSDMNSGSQESLTYPFAPNAPLDGMQLNEYPNGNYRILIKGSFCQIRTGDRSECAHWGTSNSDYQLIYYDTIEINSAFTGNSQLNSTIYSILTIVNDYVIPVLWLLLGVLLIIRGVILAMAIVKSSDEAEVRQQKIRGFVWLVIGVFAGYVVTISASAVMSMLGYGGIFS